MEHMRILGERRLRLELGRKERNLRMVLGHLSFLDYVTDQILQSEDPHDEDVEDWILGEDETEPEAAHISTEGVIDQFAQFAMMQQEDHVKEDATVTEVEVDDEEDASNEGITSDESSESDEDEAFDFEGCDDLSSVRIQMQHAPPEFVELDKSSLLVSPVISIQQTCFEVAEDDY